MKGALRHCSVSQKTDRNASLLFVFDGEGSSRGNGNMPPDNAEPPQHPVSKEVHGAASSFGIPRRSPVEFRHQFVRSGAQQKSKGMTAISSRPPVILSHHLDRSEERRVGKECRSRWSPYH